MKLSKKRILKFIFYTLLALALVCGVLTPSVSIKLIEAFIIFGIVAVSFSWYEKKYQLRLLSRDYKNQQKLLSNIFQYSPDLIYCKDKNFKYTATNKDFVAMQGGKPLEEIIGRTDFDLFPSDTANEVRIHDEKVLTTKQVAKYIQKMTLPSGEEKFYEVVKTPMEKDGEVSGVLGISRDITDMHNLQERIFEKQSQLSAILDNMPYVAYLKDTKGKFLRGNNKLQELLGLEEGYVGKYPHELFLQEHVLDIIEEDKIVVEQNKTIVVERQINTVKGKIWFDIHKAPICNSQGEVIGVIVVAKNIEAEKNIEAQKETFIATLTHDLKTPTTAQIRALNLLLEGCFGKINSDQREILEQTLNSCKYMFNMISTILSTYKIDSGLIKMNFETYSLKELTQECCDELFHLCKEKGHTIIFSSTLVKEEVFADKLEIKRVLINLLSNAISYAIPNSIIEVSLKEIENNVIFEVQNTSAFIPPHRMEMLFDKYAASKFRQVGTGLGLYLSKQIITEHHGEMIAKSDELKGNTFGFSIPRVYSFDESELLTQVLNR